MFVKYFRNDKNYDEANPILNHSFAWLTMSDQFYHAAVRLDDLAAIASESLYHELQENLKNGLDGIWRETTDHQAFTWRDKALTNISPYLYYHSIELLIKGILLRVAGEEIYDEVFKKAKKANNGHLLSIFLSELKSHLKPFPLDAAEEKSAITMLNELSYIFWTFRYPHPGSGKIPNREALNVLTVNIPIGQQSLSKLADTIDEVFSIKYKNPLLNLRSKLLAALDKS